MSGLDMWTIYEKPRDHPEHYVARRWSVATTRGSCMVVPRMSPEVMLGETLDAVRRQLPPGLVNIMRRPEDDPCIVEVWL